MRLEPLYTVNFTTPEAWSVEAAADAGIEGRSFLLAEGRSFGRLSSSRAGLLAPAALAAGSGSNPLVLFPALVLSAIALSVLLAWIFNSTGGSLLPIVLLHATANLPATVLFAPLAIDMIRPFLIFTALLIIAAVVVVGLAGPADLSRTQRKQTSDDVPTGSTTVPAS
jgi:hypothetical protein